MTEIFTLGPNGMTRLSKRPSLQRGTKLIYHYYAGNFNECVLLDDTTGRAAVIDWLDEWKAGNKESIRERFDKEKGEYEYGADAYMQLDGYARHIKDKFGIGVYYTDEVLPEEDVKAAEELAKFITECRANAKERAAKEYEDRRAELRREWGGILTENPKSDKEVNANIRKWLGVKYPGCKFSVRKNHHDSATIEGVDGPSCRELTEACSIWQTGHSDPSGDYWDDTNSVFNDLYGGWSFLHTERELSPETRERLRAMVKTDFPQIPDTTDPYKEGLRVSENYDLYYKVCEKYGLKREGYDRYLTVASVLNSMRYDMPVMPEIKPKSGNKADKGDKVSTAPVKGVEIVEYSEKAIAIIGDTKSIKDLLKSLGGSFNPRLTCGAGWIFSKKKEDELRAALAL